MVGRLAHSAASRSEAVDSCQIRSYTFSGSCGSYSARFPLDPTFFGPFILITWSLCRLGMAKDRVHMGFQPYGNGKVHVVGPWEWPVGDLEKNSAHAYSSIHTAATPQLVSFTPPGHTTVSVCARACGCTQTAMSVCLCTRLPI